MPKARKSFGQKVPSLLDYIKGILRRYPDGGQILKELIQNADDAEASRVVFLFDERTHPSNSLFLPELEPFQGPALFVYNDSVFAEEDWEGIQTISCSVKRNDPNKVGQFGIGFNSIYHITDLPAIFSGSSVALLEPRETIFEREGGHRWSLEDPDDREVLERCRDQFGPFRDVLRQVEGAVSWDTAMGGRYFRGTLFRFPLRRAPTAISNTVYDAGKVSELFESFAVDADMSLLFLRHVTSISLGYLRAGGETETLLRINAVSQSLPLPLALSSPGEGESSTRMKTISRREGEGPEQTCRWLLSTCVGPGGGLAALAASLSLTPRVDLAFPLTEPQPGFTGRLSCYLPLPDNESNRTGLPVHLNASFGLTDNRRHVKWPESDQKHDEAAQWNELLVSEVLPKAYGRLVLDAVALVKATNTVSSAEVYRLWPDGEKTERSERWAATGERVSRRLAELEALCLAAGEERWVKAELAMFLPSGAQPPMRLALAGVLVNAGKPLVEAPRHVFLAVRRALEAGGRGGGENHVVTPAYLRQALAQLADTDLSRAERLLLLEFALGDGRFGELNNLPLLPRVDGSFARFLTSVPAQGPTWEQLALVETADFPRVLLPGCEGRFLPEDLEARVEEQLREIAVKRTFANLMCLNTSVVLHWAGRSLPKDWDSARVTWDPSRDGHPPSGWLRAFWRFLRDHSPWALGAVESLPLVPLGGGDDDDERMCLARLSAKTSAIFLE